ncbi:MAG: SDR family NAD(P)-dependent oxidoreductase [Pseudomonadota bacterium]
MNELTAPKISPLTRLLDQSVVPGMMTFTRLGYVMGRCSKPVEERLDGRRVVLTGPTSGLGLATANELARLGATLVLVGRDEVKLKQVVADLNTEHCPPPEVEVAELAELAEVRKLAERLLAGPAPIHVLINNAGALFNRRSVTSEGNEQSLAVNLLSPFLLTELLKDRLVASAPARVINVSSGGMYTQAIDLDDLQWESRRYNGPAAYAQAKRGQVIMTERWAKEMAAKQVAVHAMHPGWADTPGVRNSLPGFFKVTKRVLRSPAEGADTIVWLAAAADGGQTTGGFWLDRKARPTNVLPGTQTSLEDRGRLLDRLRELAGLEPA